MASSIFILGLIIDTVGKILLGITVIKVHSRVATEKRIDKRVIKEMNHEKKLGYLSVFMIIIGATIQIIFI